MLKNMQEKQKKVQEKKLENEEFVMSQFKIRNEEELWKARERE